MLQDLILRNEKVEDIEPIFRLTQSAFEHAEHSSHTEQFIVNALRNAQMLTISLVAELNHEIIGHVAISPVEISSGAQGWYGLGPISVAPEYQQRGVGTALMKQVIERLQQLDAAGCVLLGDPHYYAKFGFKPHENLTLANIPAEYFQVLAFKQPVPQGEVKYHAAFEATK